MSQSNDNACKSSAYHGCGASTQISGSISGHLNFLAPAPTSRGFWLPFRDNGLKNQKRMYYLYSSLAIQTISVDPEPKFPSPAQPSKSFWLRPFKIASDPAPQPCCVLSSFTLAWVAGQFIFRLKLFSKWELSIGLDLKSNVLLNTIASKSFSIIIIFSYELFKKKYFIA